MNKRLFSKHLFTRCVALMLSVIVVFSIGMTAFASDASREDLPEKEECLIDSTNAREMTPEEFTELIAEMERFVTVNKDGEFEFDAKGAEEAGIGEEIVLAQANAFEVMNREIGEGKLSVDENMDLEILSMDSCFYPIVFEEAIMDPGAECEHTWSCRGGRTTSASVKWWGIERYTCDCLTKSIVSQLKNVAYWSNNVSKLTKILKVLFVNPVCLAIFKGISLGTKLAAWYINSLANSMTSHNHGHGVDICITWLFVYAVYSQR